MRQLPNNFSLEKLEASPRGRFLFLLSSYFKTPDQKHFSWYCPDQRRVMGVFTLGNGDFTFLSDDQCAYEVVHVWNIFFKEECKGSGLWRQMMEILKELAELTGVSIYFVAKAFRVNLPLIEKPEEFLAFIKTDYVKDYKDKDKEKWYSELLRRSYWKFGYCGLTVDDEYFSDDHWKRNALGYCPSTASDTMKRTFGERLTCDEEEFLSRFQTINDGERRKNRKRNKKRQSEEGFSDPAPPFDKPIKEMSSLKGLF